MKYLFVIILFIIFTGCKKDFLELTDTSNINRQTYVKDLTSMADFVNGLHLMVSRDFMRDAAPAYGEAVADNLKPSFLRTPVLLPHYSWAQKAQEENENVITRNSTAMNAEWRNAYLDIRAASFVIEEIDKYRGEDPAKADLFKGQAFAIRAMVHFKLINIFAQPYVFTSDASHIGIPYVTTSDITASLYRASVGNNYESMIRDLQEAIRLMPAETSDTRIMNQLTAKALLARLYLYKGDFLKARQTAQEVTDKVPLMTIANGYPAKMFYFLPSSQTESLYQLTPIYAETESNSVVTAGYGNTMRNNTFISTNDMAEMLIEYPDDARKSWVKKIDAGWQATKYPSGVAGIHLQPGSDYYQTVIRTSEMYLTIAEAAAKTGDEDIAREYLNTVRTRAIPGILPVEATGTALLDSIYRERRKELAFEGNRLFDLQRWKQSIIRKDFAVGGADKLQWPSSKLIAPIPVLDVRMAGIQQNLDY